MKALLGFAAAGADGFSSVSAHGLPAGSDPTTTPSSLCALDFGIPGGDKGDAGAAGTPGKPGARGSPGPPGGRSSRSEQLQEQRLPRSHLGKVSRGREGLQRRLQHPCRRQRRAGDADGRRESIQPEQLEEQRLSQRADARRKLWAVGTAGQSELREGELNRRPQTAEPAPLLPSGETPAPGRRASERDRSGRRRRRSSGFRRHRSRSGARACHEGSTGCAA